jgi:hypothetical protein
MATRASWAARVHDRKRSGLTAAEYAAREGLKAGTLKWWSSKLNRSARPASRPPVVEVALAGGRTGNALEVMLTSGARVSVPMGFDEATLRRLLAVLEDR